MQLRGGYLLNVLTAENKLLIAFIFIIKCCGLYFSGLIGGIWFCIE